MTSTTSPPSEASTNQVDILSSRRIHIVGVGGSGMSGIALILARLGHVVSGSDLKDSEAMARLRAHGITAHVGHGTTNLPGSLDAVVVSTAIASDNAEVVEARNRGISVLRRAEILALIVNLQRCIAVSGTHGKTTTSSMLSLILRAAGWRPSFLIGGDVNEVGGNAVYDSGEWLVVEADESDGTFLELEPEVVLVTSVEPDHLEYYGGYEALIAAFRSFVDRPLTLRVMCADDPMSARLASEVEDVVTYGESEGSDYLIEGYQGGRSGSRFDLRAHGEFLGQVEVVGPGRHNALNAAGAAACALELGVPFDAVVDAMGRFAGVARRFQFHGEVGGVTLVDDYAHLPGEVVAALAAAREGGWRSIVAVFQPHRYSRTAELWRDFAGAFVDADALVLTDVYPAGEAPRPGVSGRLVLQAVLDAHPQSRVAYAPRRSDVLAMVKRIARPGDLVLTLGAGDLVSLPGEWMREASASPGTA